MAEEGQNQGQAKGKEASASDLASLWSTATPRQTGATPPQASVPASSTGVDQQLTPPEQPKKRKRRRKKSAFAPQQGVADVPEQQSETSAQQTKTSASASDLASLWSAPPSKAVPRQEPSPLPTKTDTVVSQKPTEPATLAEEKITESTEEPIQELIDKSESEQKPIEGEVRVRGETLVSQVSQEKPINGEVVEEPEHVDLVSQQSQQSAEDLSEPDVSLTDRLDEFLSELHLEKRHLITGCGCCIVIIALVVAGVWGSKFFFGEKSFFKGEKDMEETEQEEQTISFQKEPIDSSIKTTLLFGRYLSLPDSFFAATGISEAVSIGENADAKSALRRSIVLLKRIENAYETDIHALLDQATDRRGVLKNHVSLLKALQREADGLLPLLRDETAQYEAQFKAAVDRRDQAEKEFFNALNEFNPQAESSLEAFITDSSAISEMRARFKAISNMVTLYDDISKKLSARIKDIELNEEALIKGIAVFNVQGSDLNLVIEEGL